MSDGQGETTSPNTLHGGNAAAAEQQKQGGPAEIADRPEGSLGSPDTVEDFLFHLYRGSEFLQDNRVEDAKQELERALRLQPNDAKVRDLLAVVHFRSGQYPRAIEIYEELTRAFPNELSLTQNLAISYLKTGQAEKARTLLERLVMAQPDHLRGWGYLALAFERLGEYEKARVAFERAGQSGMSQRMADRMIAASAGQSPAIGAAQVPARTVSAFCEIDACLVDQDIAMMQPPVSSPKATGPLRTEGSGSLGLSSDTAAVGRATPFSTPAAEASRAVDPAARPRASRPPISDLPPSVGRRHFSAVTRPAPWQVSELAHGRLLDLPDAGALTHASGMVFVHVQSSFVVRGACVRATSADGDGFRASPVRRKARGRALDESLGGVEDPMILLSGHGCIILGPHDGHKLVNIQLDDEGIYLHERALVAFDGGLSCESGRLGGGGGPPTPVVQLRGRGGAVFEVRQELACLDVTSDRGAVVDERAIVGWTGRLISRQLEENDGFGPRGRHFALAGDGTVFLSLATVGAKLEGPRS